MSKYTEHFKVLQTDPKNIRNICILAHVDHGKTTLADHLITSNEIISSKSAGTVRYLDSREDEQQRKITMKASNISLYFKSEEQKAEYLVNLIDSPGHVDFSNETSAAVRLSDGAIVVVDVVEGVCAQTRTMLQQAYNENLKPILFLNKMDRLVLEKQLSEDDAEDHLRKVLEQVNAVVGNIFASSVMAGEDASQTNQESALETAEDSTLYFDPNKGNVIFGSAQDGWGFVPKHFAPIAAAKAKTTPDLFNDFMWGDNYFNSRKKRCDGGAYGKSKTTLFSSCALGLIWRFHEHLLEGPYDNISAICEKYKLKYRPPTEKKTTISRRPIFRSVLMEYLPLHKIIFEKIVEHVTSPAEMLDIKLSTLLSLDATQKPEIKFADDDESKVIAVIAKMVPIPYRALQACDKSVRDDIDEKELILIAFARIYSGVLKENSKVHLVQPGYNPKEKNLDKLKPVTVKRVYLMMGMNFERIEEAHAGMIVGIWGLHEYAIKTGTLSSSFDCPPLCGPSILAPPVLRVAVEPVKTEEMHLLTKGLKILNQVDSCVQIIVQETGETVLCVLGEVHLEKCIHDLTTLYANIELKVSKPIVQFRETIVDQPTKAKEIFDEEKTVTKEAPDGTFKFKMIALPLPSNITKALEDNKDQLKVLMNKLDNEASDIKINKELIAIRSSLTEEMEKAFEGAITSDDIWSVGPKKLSTCMLVNKSGYKHLDFWTSSAAAGLYDRAIINGFQATVQSGPLCNEPMQGVCFVMLGFHVDESREKTDSSISGIIITAVKDACRLAFKKQPQRLVTPMYSLSVIVSADVQGRCHGEITKRGGRVLDSDMIAGSGLFKYEAVIPVSESFDFGKELLVRTSGLAVPQLRFSHWETIEEDPYWTPTTEEELEQFGDKADTVNRAKAYVDSIRERKGMYVDKKLVEHGEKQRTLSKNK